MRSKEASGDQKQKVIAYISDIVQSPICYTLSVHVVYLRGSRNFKK